MTSILKNVDIDKLGDISDEYNNIYHRTIKINVNACRCKAKHIYSL